MELSLQELFLEKKKTLAIAESCTGGFLAHLITKNPGASQYFLGSFVTYSNEVKKSILGVKEKTLKEWGAVSESVVLEMVRGVFEATSADFALAISGIAGPEGGSLEKPVGTIWIATQERGEKPITYLLSLKGDRQNIIQEAAKKALLLLYQIIER